MPAARNPWRQTQAHHQGLACSRLQINNSATNPRYPRLTASKYLIDAGPLFAEEALCSCFIAVVGSEVNTVQGSRRQSGERSKMGLRLRPPEHMPREAVQSGPSSRSDRLLEAEG